MTEHDVLALVRELLAISPETSGEAELAHASRLNARLQSFAAHYAIRCSRRADELKSHGATNGGFATLLEASGAARDAKATGERDRACATVPQLGDALATGAVSAEHLDVLARHTKGLTDDERNDVEARADELTAIATSTSAWNFERQAKQLIEAIRARHRPRHDAEELDRQRAASSVKRWTERSTGMRCTMIWLDPIRDAQMHAVFDATLKQLKRDPANADVPFEQLKVRAVLDSITAPGSGMSVPEVNIHVDAATVESGRHDHSLCELIDGTPVPVSTMQRFLCDAIVRAVMVEPDGSVRRLATLRTPNRTQRRAIEAMYATCAHPECSVPVTACKIHHVVWYSRRGATLLDNLVPVCEQHHHLVHEGGWSLTLSPDRMLTWCRPDGTVWRTHRSPNRSACSDLRPERPPGRQPAA
jgi:hypothetical protein